MKKILLTLAVCFCVGSTQSLAQFTMGVTPSLTLNGFYVGYQFGDFVPFAAVQYWGGSANEQTSSPRFDQSGNLIYENDNDKISASVFMPTLGAKYFAINKSSLKGYARVAAFLPIVSQEQTPNTLTPEESESISAWGMEFGVGAEYFIGKQCSLGGEFGMNTLSLSFTQKSNVFLTDPKTQNQVVLQRTNTLDFNLGLVYSRISLNFYFGD